MESRKPKLPLYTVHQRECYVAGVRKTKEIAGTAAAGVLGLNLNI